MKLRGITTKHKPVLFSIEDIPVSINTKLLATIGKENSPLIIQNSVMRGTDDGLFFESDFVSRKEDLKFVGYVIYRDGFYIWYPKTDTYEPLRNVDKYVFTENLQMHRVKDIQDRKSTIRFMASNRLFAFERVMYGKGQELFIDLKESMKPIYFDDIKMCTGCIKDSYELVFGQTVSDGVIELHDFHPMVRKYNGEFRELEESDYGKLGTVERP